PSGRTLIYTSVKPGALPTLERRSSSLTIGGLRADADYTQVDWQPCVAHVTVSCTSVSPPAGPRITPSCGLVGGPCSGVAGGPVPIRVICTGRTELVRPPAHGTVALSALTATYRPADGYSGPDGFAVRSVLPDGRVSEPLAITVNVTAKVFTS